MPEIPLTDLNLVGFTPAVVDWSKRGGPSRAPVVFIRMILNTTEVMCCLTLVEANSMIDQLLFAQNRARILMESSNDAES